MLICYDEGTVINGNSEVMPITILLATFSIVPQKNNVKLKMRRKKK